VPGRVFIRQGGASFSYHADAAKTAAARHEGFFTVGDIGYLDEAGYLFLCDRASDVIVSGGVNVYPSEIEAALGTHPAVADVAVIGAPDEEWGEVVKAFVELRPGFAPTAELEAELIAHARDRIAAFKCPRLVELGGALPRDDNGKLRRRELRDAAWAGRDRAI
jgi:long-chain acyl-CoA synthetase